MQMDITDKQVNSRNQSNSYKNIDPKFLMDFFGRNYIGDYNDSESNVEAKAILEELIRVKAITCVEYNKWLASCFDKKDHNSLIFLQTKQYINYSTIEIYALHIKKLKENYWYFFPQ